MITGRFKRVITGNAGPRKRRQRFRVGTRLLVLFLAVLTISGLAGASWGAAGLISLSPYVATGSLLAAQALPGLAWLGLVIGVMTLFRRRLFCRWLCPTGLLLDGAGQLGRIGGRGGARSSVVGSWVLWITLGGACLGFPIFLWLDPLALFTAGFTIGRPQAGLAWGYSVSAVVLLVVLNVWRPGSWCRQLCPLGAMQEATYGLRRLFRRRRVGEQLEGTPAGWGLSRRVWLGLGMGAAGALSLPGTSRGGQPVLRPPGALSQPTFSAVCVRCGNCQRACRAEIIQSSRGEGGWFSVMTPRLTFGQDYCREDCVRCVEVCPTGALSGVRLGDKAQIKLGRPRVRLELCWLTEERECSHCRNWCPYEAIRYVFSEEDYALRPEVEWERCNGCGACEAHCPVSPLKAITIEPI